MIQDPNLALGWTGNSRAYDWDNSWSQNMGYTLRFCIKGESLYLKTGLW